MNNKANVFCDKGYFNLFVDRLKSIDMENFAEYGNSDYFKLYNLLFQRCDIAINLSHEELIQLFHSNPYYKILIKNQSFKPSQLEIEESSEKNNILFLLDKPENEIKQFEENAGSYYSSSIGLANYTFPFKSKPAFNFNHSNPFKNYDFFSKLKHPFNSIIISDDYLFSNGNNFDRKSIELNLKPILRRILPKKLNVCLHLSIFCLPKHTIDLVSIENEIKTIFEPFEYKYTFELIVRSFHKRILITNYSYLETDRGFRNLTNDERTKQSKKCQPKNDFDFSYIFESEKIMQKYKERIKELRELFPDSKNRLIN